MKADEQKLMKINGGWHWRGERTIAVYFTIYATIIQCRSDMPDPIGGLLWFALDNVASSIYVPMYMGITSLPKSMRPTVARRVFLAMPLGGSSTALEQ